MTRAQRLATAWGGEPRDWYSCVRALAGDDDLNETEAIEALSSWATDAARFGGACFPGAFGERREPTGAEVARALIEYQWHRVWVELTVLGTLVYQTGGGR